MGHVESNDADFRSDVKAPGALSEKAFEMKFGPERRSAEAVIPVKRPRNFKAEDFDLVLPCPRLNGYVAAGAAEGVRERFDLKIDVMRLRLGTGRNCANKENDREK